LKITGKNARIIVVSVCVIALAIIIGIIALNQKPIGEISKKSNKNIEVTADELQEYKNKLGNDLDVKKAIMIIFNTKEECQAFIKENGSNDNVLTLGRGILPQMQEQNGEKFYNVVGNGVFEPIFDTLQDGEHLKEPIEFGGMYCYFKKLKAYKITENDEDLKAFIRNEKSMQKVGE